MFLKWRCRSATRICPKRNLLFSGKRHTSSTSYTDEIFEFTTQGWDCLPVRVVGGVWETYLWDKELSDALWQPPFLTRQYHLQHVTMELLHDDKHTLWRLKHALQVHHTRVVKVLQNTITKRYILQ